MALRGQKIGQFRAQPARRKIRKPAHVVEWLKGGAGGDDTMHGLKLTASPGKQMNFHRSIMDDQRRSAARVPFKFIHLHGRLTFIHADLRLNCAAHMSKIVGIDLGTTNSLVATVDSCIPLVMADGNGQRLTPSVVHFPAPDATPLVGHAANRVRVLQPATPKSR
jgi:hypothetical protein